MPVLIRRLETEFPVNRNCRHIGGVDLQKRGARSFGLSPRQQVGHQMGRIAFAACAHSGAHVEYADVPIFDTRHTGCGEAIVRFQ